MKYLVFIPIILVSLILMSTVLFTSERKIETSEEHKSETSEECESDISELEPGFIHTITEIPPRFPGGERALTRFYGFLKYPMHCRDSNIEGDVLVSFVVEKNGSLTDIEIIEAPDTYGCFDKEVVRWIDSMPNWLPGKTRGRVVRSQFTMRVRFTLTGGEEEAPV
jgi:protein TonB